MQNTFSKSLLRVMFAEARRSKPPSRHQLAVLLGAPLSSIDEALGELEGAGLADSRRCCLTVMGLMMAAGSDRLDSRRSEPRVLAA
jgi:hypothetical protein